MFIARYGPIASSMLPPVITFFRPLSLANSLFPSRVSILRLRLLHMYYSALKGQYHVHGNPRIPTVWIPEVQANSMKFGLINNINTKDGVYIRTLVGVPRACRSPQQHMNVRAGRTYQARSDVGSHGVEVWDLFPGVYIDAI